MWVWFYDGWWSLLRVVVMGLLAYPALILLLRISGKRTLSKMNAFDLTITIAFGSVLAAVLLNSSVSLAEGVAAFSILVGMQFSVAWLSVRLRGFRRTIKATPTILYWGDDFLSDVCRHERVAESEIRCAVRQSGHGEMHKVQAVILETTGDLSVLPKGNLDEIPDCAPDEVGQAQLSALIDPTNHAGSR